MKKRSKSADGLKAAALALVKLVAAASIAGAAGFLIYNADQVKEDYINLSRHNVLALTNVENTSGGTGFYVKTPSGKTVILTNRHVCGLATAAGTMVAHTESGKADIAQVLALYDEHDLCILSAPAGTRGLELAKSARNTEQVFVVGHPLLEPTSTTRGELSGAMTLQMEVGINIECVGKGLHKIEMPENSPARFFGIESVCVRDFTTNPVTANVLPGNSGSPVLNAWGKVIGVVFAGREGSARGYIVPLEEVTKFLKDK